MKKILFVLLLFFIGSAAFSQPKGKVLIVQSYYKDYIWARHIEDSIREVLEPAGIECKTFYMDTKRYSSNFSKMSFRHSTNSSIFFDFTS